MQRQWLDYLHRALQRAHREVEGIQPAASQTDGRPTGRHRLQSAVEGAGLSDRRRPLRTARSMWDLDGNEYIDLLSGFGANLLGYQPSVSWSGDGRATDTRHRGRPAASACGRGGTADLRVHRACERVAFCNTGSEAVMGAMRIARTVTGRKTIAIFTNSYHGIFDEVIVRGTKQLRSISGGAGHPRQRGREHAGARLRERRCLARATRARPRAGGDHDRAGPEQGADAAAARVRAGAAPRSPTSPVVH